MQSLLNFKGLYWKPPNLLMVYMMLGLPETTIARHLWMKQFSEYVPLASSSSQKIVIVIMTHEFTVLTFDSYDYDEQQCHMN